MILSLVAWDFHDFVISGVRPHDFFISEVRLLDFVISGMRLPWFCHHWCEISMILSSVVWDFRNFVISGAKLHDFVISGVRLPWFCYQWCETSWFCYQQCGDVKLRDFVFRLSVMWDFMSLLSVMSLIKKNSWSLNFMSFFYKWRQTSGAFFQGEGISSHIWFGFPPSHIVTSVQEACSTGAETWRVSKGRPSSRDLHRRVKWRHTDECSEVGPTVTRAVINKE